jgi:hypothetical protein
MGREVLAAKGTPMRRIALVLTLLTVLLAPHSAQAERRWRSGMPNKYYQRSAYAQAVYPRYEAGFHARYFQNIGIPSGDVGLRGNSMFMSPW